MSKKSLTEAALVFGGSSVFLGALGNVFLNDSNIVKIATVLSFIAAVRFANKGWWAGAVISSALILGMSVNSLTDILAEQNPEQTIEIEELPPRPKPVAENFPPPAPH